MDLRTLVWNPYMRLIWISMISAAVMRPLPNAENKLERVSNEVAAIGTVIGMEQSIHLQVMTYNIRHGRGLDGKVKLGRIAEDIRKSKAEIIALQEVDRFNIRSGFKDQVKILAEMLNMNWCYSPSLKFGVTQYGNAILSQHAIVSSEMYVLPGKRESRTLLKASIIKDHEKITVYTTHLGLQTAERDQQLSLISEIMNQTGGLALFMGDFNMESSHSLMMHYMNQWKKLNPKVKHATVLSGLEIDHIYVNTAPQHSEVWTMLSDASDHNPVIAQFYWGAAGRSMLAYAQ